MDKKLQDFIENNISPEPNSGCWLWMGTVGSTPYGHTKHKGKTIMAHRLSYIAFKSEIPEGLEIDHLCRVKLCVNPNHLEAVTHSENMKRHSPFDKRVQSQYCINGHILDGIRKRPTGGRFCKTCVLIRKRQQRAKGKRN